MAHIVEERSEAKADKKRLNRGTRILRNIVIVIVVIALLLGAAVFVLDHFGRSKLTDDAAEMTVIDDAELDNAGRVRYKGQLYEYKKDITTILLMGVDSRNKEDTEGEFGRSNQSDMNVLADEVPIGSEGLCIIPFGNGAERLLQNREIGCSIHGLNFNIHKKAHLLRAAQEGIVFSFAYGMEIMKQMGMEIKTIKAGHANMFLNPMFRRTLASVTGANIELYETDGAAGAAKGAGIGAGIYKDSDAAFATLKHHSTEVPDTANTAAYMAAYERWKEILEKQ